MSAHIVPTGDAVEHRPDRACPCGPTVRVRTRRGEVLPAPLLYVHRRLGGPAFGWGGRRRAPRAPEGR